MPIEALELRTLPETLQGAQVALEAGKWRRAESICVEILGRAPYADAAHLLGRVYVESGQRQRAIPFFRQALELDPDCADYYFSLARTLQDLGEMREAAESWLAGIQIDPSHLHTHLALSDTLLALQLFDLAVTAARQALLVDPQCAAAYERMGRAYELAGETHQAAEAWERSIELRPESPENIRHLAVLRRAEREFPKAVALLRRAIELRPRDAGYRYLLAGVLADTGAQEAAIQLLREATRMQPHFPEAWSNLGLLLRSRSRFAEAETCYKKATAQDGKFAPAWNNLANLYVEISREQDAERCYSKAIAANPDYAEAHTGRAMLRLLRGQFAEGWDEFEWRWRQPGVAARSFDKPAWEGDDLAGKTILLHAEQGAGDTIQFIRYARLLKEANARVVLHCPPSLRSLMETMPEVDAVVCGRESLPVFDVHAPLMSLPRLLGTEETSVPSETPYLHVPATAQVPEPLATAAPLRVGLVWAGNPNHRNDRNRSIRRELFAGITRIEGASFFSLQVGGDAEEPVSTDLAPYLSDYGVTAACLEHLDLLISVDTSVVHLAGALHRPVWMLLPSCNDWRWLLNRADSPWYPSLRIFRQNSLGDWPAVLSNVASELARLVTTAQRQGAE